MGRQTKEYGQTKIEGFLACLYFVLNTSVRFDTVSTTWENGRISGKLHYCQQLGGKTCPDLGSDNGRVRNVEST
jgi:hypothetical protein